MKEPLITCDTCSKSLTEQVWTGTQLLCAECWEAKETRTMKHLVLTTTNMGDLHSAISYCRCEQLDHLVQGNEIILTGAWNSLDQRTLSLYGKTSPD